MPDIEPPNLGEVLRRLDGLQSSIADLIAEMKADRAENARIYVRADVYMERSKVQDQNIKDLHRDVGEVDKRIEAEAAKVLASVGVLKVDTDAKFAVIESERKSDLAWRRQIMLTVGGIAVTVLVAIVGFVLQLTR